MRTKNFYELTAKDVASAGGKGASLGEMTQVKIPVPPGFVVLAPTFDEFLHATDLTQEVAAQFDKVNYQDVASVEYASAAIHGLITEAQVPKEIEDEIFAGFDALGAEFVAVRSSATAEDSSAASWAGELESYLNTTRERLIENVKKCWASLFTPRAIVYRHEQDLHGTHVSVAVVVQKMVQSEVAGITFTVHPVTKDQNQMIIEACWGLGELIVGGRVTPDAYVVDKRDGTLIDVNVSEQDKMLARSPSGNALVDVPQEKRAAQKLADAKISELAEICKTIETHYAFPCDIEWALENDKFYIVQSRPITTL
ncbi:MAG: PEP/pyruvate-binding domain-containing protein [Patescibacteria group bacterium]